MRDKPDNYETVSALSPIFLSSAPPVLLPGLQWRAERSQQRELRTVIGSGCPLRSFTGSMLVNALKPGRHLPAMRARRAPAELSRSALYLGNVRPLTSPGSKCEEAASQNVKVPSRGATTPRSEVVANTPLRGVRAFFSIAFASYARYSRLRSDLGCWGRYSDPSTCRSAPRGASDAAAGVGVRVEADGLGAVSSERG